MSLFAILRWWGPVVLVMALIFTASSVPDPGPLPGDVSDKFAHFGAYALLGATIVRALAQGRLREAGWRQAAGAVFLSIAYGATDELHQMMVPGRTPDWRDLLADAAGATAGALAVLVLRVWLLRRAPIEGYTRGD